ncbi:MAG TPA: DEAD/DEAH box helicase [Rhodocyclaceae bacterium]|nr:DEAD/DEAH box helicase [Rhodocyclaceae bacterium]
MTTSNDFASLGLAEPLLRAIADTGYTTPTPIQAQAIPLVLAGGDLLAAAQTGTGKTAGFTLPVLQRLSSHHAAAHKPGRPRCLILTPTRELAAQVQESVETYGRHLPLTSMVMFGGVNINPQIHALRSRVDILVATPGRLLDHAGQKTVDLSGVEILVLDEADRMLDMGFIRDIRRILALLPQKRQSLLFSATFSDEIRELANGLLKQPGCVEVARRNTTSELVSQSVYMIGQKQKRELLTHLVRQNDWRQVLVFTRTKHGANKLAEYLGKQGIASAAIHGNKSQSARTRALAQFKDGALPVLVATDIAARGLDIDQLPHVVNFELPNVPEDYVHRIGRTGRAGSPGHAISLVDVEETKHLAGIERLIRTRIARATADGFIPNAIEVPGRDDVAPESPHATPRTPAPRRGSGRHGSSDRPVHARPRQGGAPSVTTRDSSPRRGQPDNERGTQHRDGGGARPHGAANTVTQAPRGGSDGRRRARGGQNAAGPRAALFSPKQGNRGR